jgi:hypothetical protein
VFQRWLFWPLFATIMGFALGGSVVWGILYVPPQQNVVQNQQPGNVASQREQKDGFWEKTSNDPVAYFTLWLVGFTGVLAVSTIGLWIVTWRASVSQARDMKASIAASEKSVDIARDAMIAGERAFVFTTELIAYWELDPTTNLYNWRFRPKWKNSGDTPTKHMIIFSECVLRTAPLPVGFDFNYPTRDTGTALIPPSTEAAGGVAPRFPAPAITPHDILDVQTGRKILYYWGWAKYFDVFPDTPEHVTRFCWQVLPIGDPLAYDPKVFPQNLNFSTINHPEGNCADDECNPKAATYTCTSNYIQTTKPDLTPDLKKTFDDTVKEISG